MDILIWVGGGVFLGLYIGNLTLRTKINEGVSKIINKSKESKNNKKGTGKKN